MMGRRDLQVRRAPRVIKARLQRGHRHRVVAIAESADFLAVDPQQIAIIKAARGEGVVAIGFDLEKATSQGVALRISLPGRE